MRIRVDEVLDAANALPLNARRLFVAALRERNPYYCWVIEKSGRLTCNHGSPARTAYGGRLARSNPASHATRQKP